MKITPLTQSRIAYLQISPRGFANETYIVAGSRAAVDVAQGIINDDVSAWARRLPASDQNVRRAKREADIFGQQVERLSESDVRSHRPTYLHNDGSRSLGREPLPA